MIKKLIGVLLIAVLFLGVSCASMKASKNQTFQVSKEQAQAAEEPEGQPQAAEEPKEQAQAAEEKKAKKAPAEQPVQKPEEVNLPTFKTKKAPRELPLKEPIDPKKLVNINTPVLINAESMPLSSFIVYAVGDILKVTYVLDEPVMNMKNPVTLKMNQALPPEQVMEIVLGFLQKYDLTIEEKAGALYITKTKAPVKKPMDVQVGRSVRESGAEVLQVIPINHIRANEIDGLIREVYKTGVTIKAYQKENALLLSGPAFLVKEIIDFIEVFDVPYMQGKRPFMIKLIYWQADDFIKQITTILEGLGFSVAKTSKDPGVFIIPVKVLNSALVVAPDDLSRKYILDWVGRLDTAESAGTEEKPFVYVPQYSKASDLVESLDKLYGVTEGPSQTTPQTGAQATQSGSAPAPPRKISQTSTTSGQKVLIVTGMRIASDDKRNRVLVSATPSRYKTILSYLTSLDVPPKQVLIEATIAELTLKGDLQYGLEWYIKNNMQMPGTSSSNTESTSTHGPYQVGTLTGVLGSLGVSTKTGVVYKFISDNNNFQVLFNAFAQDNKINILSSPRLMVIDNQQAHIQIGTDIPIITGETSSSAPATQNVVTTQSVQYRSTGLLVTVKPNINTEGTLTLEIAIESSEAQTNKLSGINSPIIITRKLTTSVVAASEETIVIGGIMGENVSITETKIPLLGDIPFFGNAFKNTSNAKTKTELIITLKPVIITSTDDAVRVSDDLRRGMSMFK
jgi:general secretion pathway protein D